MMQVFAGARVFDGFTLHEGRAVMVDGGRVRGVVPVAGAPPVTERLEGGILVPAFLDLQVNGGGGLAVGSETDLAALRHICATHLALGTGGILPTLITDTAEVTERVMAAGIAAEKEGVPGFLGLHLEGPHLNPRRKGAHEAALIRPMGEGDLQRIIRAKQGLRHLMVTLAPEAVTPDQISALARAGVLVSLGHTDCRHAQAIAAMAAGAGCTTHLFNAMSQMGNREPGLVGAVLDSTLPFGIIADGIHVTPAVMRVALAARRERAFAVTDCMAFAGTGLAEMRLNGRRVLRREGRLTLEDGTLAGADLTLPRALQVLTGPVGLSAERALAMVTRIPADVIGAADRGRLETGARADLLHLTGDFAVRQAWHEGRPVAKG